MNRMFLLSLAMVIILSPTAMADETALLAGDTLDAWQKPLGDWLIVEDTMLAPDNPGQFTWTQGSGVAVNGKKGKTRHLVSKAHFGDVEAHIEFMVPQGSNSGVYFQGRYEIQVLDSWGVEKPTYGDCGGIYQRWHDGVEWDGKERGYEGRPPRVNAAKKPGEWQTFDVIFKAPRFDKDGHKSANAKFVEVKHNGMVVHENQEVTGPTRSAMFGDEQATGPLMLQGDHGPVAYRNITMKPLTSSDESSLKVLVVTGNHPYDKAAFRDLFDSDAAIKVVYREETKKKAEFLDNLTGWDYDVVVLYCMSLRISDKQRKNLHTLLNQGVGFVVLHHSNIAFAWKGFKDIIGVDYTFKDTEYEGKRYPRSHNTLDATYTINIADSDHPITKDVTPFQVTDETYKSCIIAEDNHILLTTDTEVSDAQLMWTRITGQSRIVYLQPGHGPEIFSNETYRTLMARAIQWVGNRL